MQRWQLLLELLLHHASMVGPLCWLFFLGMLWEAVFKGMPPLLLTISVGWGQDCPRRCLLAVWTLFVHPQVLLPPRHGSWALYEVGRGCWVLWPHNSPSKSCYLASRTERRVLMSSGFRHGLSSPILHQYQNLFACLRHVPGASTYGARSH